MVYKKEIRILGIDDSPFKKHTDERGKKIVQDVLVIGALFRGGNFMDGVLTAKIRKDGFNSTRKLIEMVNRSKFKKQLRCLIIDGIALGGFNIVDINKLYEKTTIPVIVVIRNYPDFKKIKRALRHTTNPEKRFALIEKAGEPKRFGKIYFQSAGIKDEKAKEIIKISSTHSFLPEPIRVAHLIGQGIVMGESKGKA